MNLRPFWLFFSFISIALGSCQSKLITVKSPESKLKPTEIIYILKNPESKIIPVGIYPPYKRIEEYVIAIQPAIYPIEAAISKELSKHNWNSVVVERIDEKSPDSDYITYTDYWAWDFKKYMHLLVINYHDADNKIVYSIVSQGNTAGMHNYPNPEKQVPLLINKLTEQ